MSLCIRFTLFTKLSQSARSRSLDKPITKKSGIVRVMEDNVITKSLLEQFQICIKYL